jgi:hypothetical protein
VCASHVAARACHKHGCSSAGGAASRGV